MEPHPRTARLPGPSPDATQAGSPAGTDADRVPVDPSLVGTVLGGRYRIGEAIGAGAMGVVWTAWDRRLRRTVAVKQLIGSAAARADPSDPAPARVIRARTLREGRIAARVVHPRAIAVFDVVIPPGDAEAPWLVMEYLPSRSLAKVLAEHGPLEPGQVAAIGAQIADALAAVHAAGIVHGDVKPGNVLIADDGVAKLTDFGVSRASWDTTATGGGMVAGTPGYVAPEVARGEDPTAASDVFSLGAALYAAVEGQLVCGDKPNHLAVLHAMAEGRLRPATRAGALGRPLAAMLRVTAEHRPDMGGVRHALAARATETPIPVAADPADPAEQSEAAAQGVSAGSVGHDEPVLTAAPAPDDRAGGADQADLAVHASSGVQEPAREAPAATGASAVSGPGEPTRLSDPVDVPVPRSGPRADDRRPGGGGRVLLVAGAAALAIGLGAGMTVAGHGVFDRVADTTRPAVAAPSPGPAAPAPTVVDQAPEPAPSRTTALASDEVGRTVSGYYDALPADVDTAWSRLSDQAREESGGYAGYTQFWRTISDVTASDVQVDGTSATARITFVTVDGRTSNETYRFRVDRGEDGRPLIESAQRASSPM